MKTPDGLGADLALEAIQSKQHSVMLRNLMRYTFTQIYGVKIVKFLAGIFGTVELLEQCSDYFKFRVPRDEKTIGFVFGQVESNKEPLGISEYSVYQTTLEQIFQTFAELNIDDKAALTFRLEANGQVVLLNPDGRRTEA